MNDSLSTNALSIYLEEYSKLKDEQISRIGFRDNLIYVNLTAVGGSLLLCFQVIKTMKYFWSCRGFVLY